jgi:hypothetical protein
MKLSAIMSISDSYTDEVVTGTNALLYANEAIAFINTKLGVNLPFFVSTTAEYTALSESWCRRLIVTYLNYSVKMNDSSLNEAAEYKNSFYEAFTDLSSVYLEAIDILYLPTTLSNVYVLDTSDAVDTGWFFNSGNRGGL